jgi:Lon protease-like protein
MTEIMLFPLSSIVLPEGKMRLKIFEPRYQRLIAEALKGDGTFGICLYEKPKRPELNDISTVGTLVRITDFESLSDGMLGVTITGIKRFVIGKVRVESDGLRFARVQWLANWAIEDLNEFTTHLSLQLEKVYSQFPALGELYEQKLYDDACWVSQRWLEILPLNREEFEHIVLQQDYDNALNFLKQRLVISKANK